MRVVYCWRARRGFQPSLIHPVLNPLADSTVRREQLVRQHRVVERGRVVVLQPLFDRSAFVRAAIRGNDRIFHDLHREGTLVCLRPFS